MTTYKIVRFYHKHPREDVKGGLTLEEAQEHCEHPSTSSTTATSDEARERTRLKGPWFDGYTKE